MKIEWLISDVMAVGSLDRAERAILGLILAVCFWPNQFIFLVGEPLCGVGTPFRSLVSLLRVI